MTIPMNERPLDFVISEANGARSRATVKLAQSAAILPAGTLLKGATLGAALEAVQDATDLQTCVAILGYNVDAASIGGGETIRATAIVRDAEVNAAMLHAGTSTAAEIADALALLGIIVRPVAV